MDNDPGPQKSPPALWVNPMELREWSDNPRINEHAVASVAESINRFGFAAPIVARPNGEIIAGHTRLRAAISLGLISVPVRYLELSESEARLLSLADNRLGELAEWENEDLLRILTEYSAEDTELAGWNSEDIDKLSEALTMPSDSEWADDFDESGDTSEFDNRKQITFAMDKADYGRLLARLKEFDTDKNKALIKWLNSG